MGERTSYSWFFSSLQPKIDLDQKSQIFPQWKSYILDLGKFLVAESRKITKFFHQLNQGKATFKNGLFV